MSQVVSSVQVVTRGLGTLVLRYICYEIFELFWSLKGHGEGGVGWGPNAKFGQ